MVKTWIKPIATLAAAMLISLSTVACGDRGGRSDGPQNWRLMIEEVEGSIQHQYALRFKEIIERETDGEVGVSVYLYGPMGSSDDTTQNLSTGVLEFAMASPGHLGSLIEEVQVFLIHWLFSDDMAVNHEVLSDPRLIEAMDELYRRHGIKFLSAFQEGWQVWNTKGRMIRSPEDFRGLKIRVMTSPMLLAAYEAYGANPTPLSYGEVFTSLQLSMIDAQVNPIFAIQEMSFHQVTDHMIFANHLPFIGTFACNEQFFDSLSPEYQQIVEAAVAELHEFVYELQQQVNEERLATILQDRPAMQVVQLDEEERQAFREAAEPLRDTYLRIGGSDAGRILDLVDSLVMEAQQQAADAP